MNRESEIRDKLRDLSRAPVQVLPALVTAVDEENLSMDVAPFEGAEILDVRLKAGIDGIDHGVIEIPALDSTVLIGLIGNDEEEAYLVKTSAVTKIIVNGSDQGEVIMNGPPNGTLTIRGGDNTAMSIHAGAGGSIEINGLSDVPLEFNKTEEGDIIMNRGTNGGLTITPTLQQELEKNNALLQALLTVISGAPIPEPGMGSPSAFQTALASAVAGKMLGNFSSIENAKVKH